MADGPGLRTSIYCAGCQHHCPGCHNPQSWNIDNGRWMDVDDLFELIVSDEISNVTFTGGDPFYQAEAFTELARRIKAETKKNIWCWTGFTIEEIRKDPVKARLVCLLFVQYQEDASDIKDMSKYKPHILLSQENTQIRDLQQENRG